VDEYGHELSVVFFGNSCVAAGLPVLIRSLGHVSRTAVPHARVAFKVRESPPTRTPLTSDSQLLPNFFGGPNNIDGNIAIPSHLSPSISSRCPSHVGTPGQHM